MAWNQFLPFTLLQNLFFIYCTRSFASGTYLRYYLILHHTRFTCPWININWKGFTPTCWCLGLFTLFIFSIKFLGIIVIISIIIIWGLLLHFFTNQLLFLYALNFDSIFILFSNSNNAQISNINYIKNNLKFSTSIKYLNFNSYSQFFVLWITRRPVNRLTIYIKFIYIFLILSLPKTLLL